MLRNELIKMLKRKSVQVFAILYAVVLFSITAGYFIGENIYSLTILGDGQFITTSLSLLMSFLLPFITVYLVSTSFSIELGEGTIKNMYLLPIKKSKIFLVKLLGIQILLAGMLGIHFIYATIISLIQEGGFSFEAFGRYILIYLGAFIILGLINIIGANLVLVVNSVGLTLLVTYLSYVGLSFASVYLPSIRPISIPSLLDHYEAIFESFSVSPLLTIFSYYIILLITGSYVFEKKEESICQYD